MGWRKWILGSLIPLTLPLWDAPFPQLFPSPPYTLTLVSFGCLLTLFDR